MEKYNIYVIVEDVKRMLGSQRFYLGNITTYLRHVESHIVCDSGGGQLDSSSSSAQALADISSSKNDSDV